MWTDPPTVCGSCVASVSGGGWPVFSTVTETHSVPSPFNGDLVTFYMTWIHNEVNQLR